MQARKGDIASRLRRTIAFVFDRRLGAARFIFRTVACTWLAIASCLAVANAVLDMPDPHQPASTVGEMLLLGLVLAPLLENLLMAGVIELLDAHAVRWRTIVVSVACISGLLHAWGFGWRGVAGFIGFATFSYSYLLWKERGFVRSSAINFCQHALINLPATLLGVFLT